MPLSKISISGKGSSVPKVNALPIMPHPAESLVESLLTQPVLVGIGPMVQIDEVHVKPWKTKYTVKPS